MQPNLSLLFSSAVGRGIGKQAASTTREPDAHCEMDGFGRKSLHKHTEVVVVVVVMV